jgi:hypothetical protein
MAYGWFFLSSLWNHGSEPGFAVSGETFGFTSCSMGSGLLLLHMEARDAAKLPVLHKPSPTTKNLPAPNNSVVPKTPLQREGSILSDTSIASFKHFNFDVFTLSLGWEGGGE